jgi:predicted  nucleic acid-binding Zn-ribbon protein
MEDIMGRLRDALEAIGNMNNAEAQMIEGGMQAIKETLGSTVKINTGSQDGISVKTDPKAHQYIVETPNNYKVFWQLASKKQGSDLPYATKLPFPQVKQPDGTIKEDRSRVQFAVDVNDLKSTAELTDFNFKIRNARFTNREIATELDKLKGTFTPSKEIVETQKAFGENPKEVVFVQSLPENHYCNGEVLKTGKHFIAVSSGEKPEENKSYVRIIDSTRLLSGAEFKDPEKALAEKCPVGSMKHFKFEKTGKIVVSDYIPKATKETTQEAKVEAVAEKQVEPKVEKKTEPKAEKKAEVEQEAKKEPKAKAPVEKKEPVKAKPKAKTKEVERDM